MHEENPMKLILIAMLFLTATLGGCIVYPPHPTVDLVNLMSEPVRVQFLPCGTRVPWGGQYSGEMYAMEIGPGATWTSTSPEAVANKQKSRSIAGGGVNYVVYSSAHRPEQTARIDSDKELRITVRPDGTLQVLEGGVPIEPGRVWYGERPERLQEWSR